MADIKALEHPTLKVSYELLNKKYRIGQKNIDKEVYYVLTQSNEIEKSLNDRPKTRKVGELLSGVVEKLQTLKRKAQESLMDESETGYILRRRLDHLKEHTTTPNEEPGSAITAQWRRRRLDRMLVEYFLRKGYYNTAVKLAHKSQVQHVTNIDVFLVSSQVERSLANHETDKCLSWCYDNRSRLRKLKSNLEFNLRTQEFIELIKEDRRMDAVKYARKYFTGWEMDQTGAMTEIFALLAFNVDTNIPKYKTYFEESRWTKLIEQFRRENYRLFQLANQSVFTCTLQAGLSALKTPYCFDTNKDQRNASCPVCQEPFNALSQRLPFAHCSQSRLICRISGLPLNEHNQPMMLPNGYVYGEKALMQIAAENNGKVQCPRTREIFSVKKLEKVFVM